MLPSCAYDHPDLAHVHFFFINPDFVLLLGGRGHLANERKYVCPSCNGLGRVSICCYFQSFHADMYGLYVL